jgi:hypothetical protein
MIQNSARTVLTCDCKFEEAVIEYDNHDNLETLSVQLFEIIYDPNQEFPAERKPMADVLLVGPEIDRLISFCETLKQLRKESQ